MGAKAGGSVLGAIGSLWSGSASSSMFKYQAGLAQLKKKVDLQNADYQRNIGEVEAQQSGLKSRAEIGVTKSIQGASGLDVNKGSPAAVRSSQQAIAGENQAIIRSNAAHRAWASEVEAATDEAQSNILNVSAKNATTSGNIGAISSLLGGATSVADKWYQGKATGLWGGSGSSEDELLIYGPGN